MTDHRATLASAAAGADRWVGVWLGLSAALLLAGLFLPAVTVRRFFFSEEYSLAGAVFRFAAAGDWFLFLVTFLFSILFPLGKIGVCLALWYAAPGGGRAVRLAGWLAAFSKWSMLDVFIIALVVLVVDGQMFSAADVHIGVVVFSAGVLLSTWAARRIDALAVRVALR